MRVREQLVFAGVGWLVGALFTVVLGYLLLPALIGSAGNRNFGSDLLLLGLVIGVVTPTALVGGLAGGNLIREGGLGSQLIMAAIGGLILAVPAGCAGFWFTGW